MLRLLFNLSIVLLLILPTVSAQNAPDTLTYFPSDRIKGGAPAFYRTVGGHISYPISANRARIVGTAIVAVTISPQGDLAYGIVNSLGKEIDQTILNALNKTRGDWLADELAKNDVVVFIPFTFALEGNQFLQHTDKPPFMMEEVIAVSPGIDSYSVIESDE